MTRSAAIRCAGVALLLAGALAVPHVALADGMRGPGRHATPLAPLQSLPPRAELVASHGHSPATGLFMGLLGFYRGVVSAVDGDRCSMAPTCSIYSHQALRKHGVLLGVLLTADRLIHEADAPALAQRIQIGGETYFLDALEDNTYWLAD